MKIPFLSKSFLQKVAVFLPIIATIFATGFTLEDHKDGLLDLNELKRAGAEVTTTKYPNAEDVMINNHIIVQYEKDGTYIVVDDTCVKILTEKSRKQYKTISSHYSKAYGTSGYSLIQIIKPDGKIIEVDIDANKKIMTDRSSMKSNIYDPNSKILTIGMPEVEIGDMIRTASWKNNYKARVPNTWCDFRIFEYSSPICSYIYEVHAPKELPLKKIILLAKVKDTVTYTKKDEENRTIHRWIAQNVPQMYEEPNMPKMYTVVQRLLVSTIEEWESISKWYWNLCVPKLESSAGIKTKVEELTKGLTSRDDKIKAIFKFVSQEIIYRGVIGEDTAPGYEPHDVKTTFSRRHGVCRDKAALLAVMLREAGFKAFPVLINNGPKKNKYVPQPYFNHAITAVEKEEGGYILMDSTDENTKELFPAYLCDQSYLVARPEGEDLLTSQIIPAEKNLLEITSDISINGQGELQGESTLNFEGINDNTYRGYFLRIKARKRREFFERIVKSMLPGAKLNECIILPEKLMDTTQKMQVFLRYTAADVLINGKNNSLLTLPKIGNRIGMVNFILQKTSLEKRKYPLETNYACGVREKINITLDASLGTANTLPQFTPIEYKNISWNQDLTQNANIIKCVSEFKLKTTEFSPNEYLIIRKTLKDLEYNDRKKIVLEKTSMQALTPNADINYIYTGHHYKIKDEHSWTKTTKVHKKILTYNGKKGNAEIKITYNPIWEKIILKKVVVTTNGKKYFVHDKEINNMDAAWVAAAPRYPGAVTMVVALPGIEVGSDVEYEIERICSNRSFFSCNRYFTMTDPCQHGELSISIPTNMQLNYWVNNDDNKIKFNRSSSAGRYLYSWNAKNLAGVKSEKMLPPWWSFNPTIFVSSRKTWKGYASELQTKLKELGKDQKKSEKLALKLIKNLKANSKTGLVSEQQKIIAIRNYIEKNINQVGPAFSSLPLSNLSPADRTLADGYGNSADSAALYSAMLNAVGLVPEFLVVSTGPHLYKLRKPLVEIPNKSLFSRVLVKVKAGLNTIYLNDIDQYAQLGTTPSEGDFCLVLKNGWTSNLRLPDANSNSKFKTNYDVVLQDDSSAIITKTKYAYGIDYAAKNQLFSEQSPEERRRYILAEIAAIAQSAEQVKDAKINFESYPGTEVYTVKIDKYAVKDGDYLYFKLPASLSSLYFMSSDKRHHDLYRSSNIDIDYKTIIHLPKSYKEVVMKPETINWKVPGGSGNISLSLRNINDTIKIDQTAHLKENLMKKENYPNILKISKKLRHQKNSLIMLKKSN